MTHPLEGVFGECLGLSTAKREGYGTDDEPFHNVIAGAQFIGVEPYKAALLRAADKFTRIGRLMETGKWGDEAFEDNALDAINYLAMAVELKRRG